MSARPPILDAAGVNAVAHYIGDEALATLHRLQAEHSDQVAVAASVGIAIALVGFVRDAVGDAAAEMLGVMVSDAATRRLDRVVPAGQVGR